MDTVGRRGQSRTKSGFFGPSVRRRVATLVVDGGGRGQAVEHDAVDQAGVDKLGGARGVGRGVAHVGSRVGRARSVVDMVVRAPGRGTPTHLWLCLRMPAHPRDAHAAVVRGKG